MSKESDSSDFEDEALDNVTSTDLNLQFNTTQYNTTTVKTKDNKKAPTKIQLAIQDLIDENISSDITTRLRIVLEDDDDVREWGNLASSLKSVPIEFARKAFKLIFEHFPNCGQFYEIYLNIEKESQNWDIINNTLLNYLPKCASVSIWLWYCSFVSEHYLKNKVGRELMKTREEVEKAYMFAVDTVGFFIDSGRLWIDYCNFLDVQLSNDQDLNYRGEQINNLRKVFRRAVVVPTNDLESLWAKYTQWEQQVNSTRARDSDELMKIVKLQKQIVDDEHSLANEVLLRRNELWQNIQVDMYPAHDVAREQHSQVKLWMKAIEFEMSNPMKLSEDVLYHHMHMIFIRCITCCRFCPDVWISFAEFESRYDISKGSDVLREAIAAMPSSVLLRIACCDFYELHGQVDQAEKEYEKMLGECENTAGWITFQRFQRRQHGEQAARDVFRRARLSLRKPEIYVAAAYLEYSVNKNEKAATRIFLAGMNHFSEDGNYIVTFADYLVSVNETASALSLLQQSVDRAKEDEKTILWEKLIEMEWRFSKGPDALKRIIDLQNKYSTAVSSSTNVGLLASIPRYTLFGYHPKSEEDKTLLKRKYPFTETESQVESIPKSMAFSSAVNAPRDDDIVVAIETPEWMREFILKLPSTGLKRSRGTIVDTLVEVLSRVKIPDRNRLIVKQY